MLIAYESRSGRTSTAASGVASAVRAAGHDAVVRPLAEVTNEEVADAEMLVVGSWVEGYVVFGVGPAKAARRWLDSLPDLGGKPAGVFCSYGVSPRQTLPTMRRLLESHGARVIAEHAANRRHPDAGAAEFAGRLLEAAPPSPS